MRTSENSANSVNAKFAKNRSSQMRVYAARSVVATDLALADADCDNGGRYLPCCDV
jgi:hypothetical protein